MILVFPTRAVTGHGAAPGKRPARRVDQLAQQGALLRGRGAQKGWLTTSEALTLETRMLAEIEKGSGAVCPILDAETAGPYLQASAAINYGMKLNAGQEAAGRLILSSTNRVVGCCQSNRNLSPIGGVRATPAPLQAMRFCPSATAAERFAW